MSDYFLSAPARRDIDDIEAFIRARNPSAARRLLRSLRETFRLLAETPGAGRAREEFGPGVRSLPVGSYVVFYRETPGGISILRVLHGRRDIEQVFGED